MTSTDTATIPHPDLGPIRLHWEDDWAHQVTYYTVKASRVTGSLTAAWIAPRWSSGLRETTEWGPDGIAHFAIAYGRTPDAGRHWEDRHSGEAADPLTVNRVRLRGTNTHRWESFRRTGRFATWDVYARAPDATRDRATEILTAVARHWLTRDPHAHLLRLATVQAAARDWAQHCRDRIATERAAIAQAEYLIAQATDDAHDAGLIAAAAPAADPGREHQP